MEQKNNMRQLHILHYLYKNTDEDHMAQTADIIKYLADMGIQTHRQTITADVNMLVDFGFDIVTVRSRQNMYFYGTRRFDLAELKMMVDAVHAAKFITQNKSEILIDKLASLTSVHHAQELHDRLFVSRRVKSTNENIIYTIDAIQEAITKHKQITFKYIEYTPDKEKAFKHNGQIYRFSPYDLTWNNDSYYVFGYSENHGKVVKFRADRIYKPEITDEEARAVPEDYDLPSYIRMTFSMYDEQTYTVELCCENELMKAVIDHFGENIETRRFDSKHFIVKTDVSVSPTFFAWIFTYAGKIKIISPNDVAVKYKQMLSEAMR